MPEWSQTIPATPVHSGGFWSSERKGDLQRPQVQRMASGLEHRVKIISKILPRKCHWRLRESAAGRKTAGRETFLHIGRARKTWGASELVQGFEMCTFPLYPLYHFCIAKEGAKRWWCGPAPQNQVSKRTFPEWLGGELTEGRKRKSKSSNRSLVKSPSYLNCFIMPRLPWNAGSNL